MSAHSRTYFVLLNEFSFAHLLFLVLCRRDVCVIENPPIVPPLGSLVHWIGRALVRRGWCRAPHQMNEVLASLAELRVPRHETDPFVSIEPSMNKMFSFDDLDRKLGADAMPSKQVICNFIFLYFDPLYYVHHLYKHIGRPEDVIVGANSTFRKLYVVLYGESIPFRTARSYAGWWELNFCLTLAALCRALASVLVHMGRQLPPQHFFLGTDFLNDPRDEILWRENANEGRSVLVVFRNGAQSKRFVPAMDGLWQSCIFGEGRIGLARALVLICDAARQLWKLYRTLGGTESGLFLRLAVIPHKRGQMRFLLNKYRFDFFWARDDYNVDHIIRTQELRSAGIKSLGVSHGLPISTIIVPMWRYIDFDIYYVIGRRIQDYYRATWSSRMKVKPVGSYGMTRDRLRQVRAAPRRTDIILQSKAERTSAGLIKAVRSLAATFPQRTIYLQIKPSFSHTFVADEVFAEARKWPNVQVTEEKIYELFQKCGYLVTDPSTIAAEAIHFGLYSFVYDSDDRKSLYFRDFPDLCVRDPEEFARRIAGLEDGTCSYRLSEYRDLAVYDSPSIYDVVREDMGLPPHVRGTDFDGRREMAN